MFELLSLLAQHNAKQMTPSPTQPNEPAAISQSNTQPPSLAPVPSVAIPEAVSVESPTPAPTATLPENSEPVRSTTHAPSIAPPAEQTPLPPQANPSPAASSQTELPRVKVQPTPPSQAISSKPLKKPSVKVPSTKIVQANSLQNKAAPNLGQPKKLPTPVIPGTASEKKQIEDSAQSGAIDPAKTTQASSSPQTAVPNLFKPRNQTRGGVVKETAQPEQKDSPASQNQTVQVDRELVFEAPKLPSQASSSPSPQVSASPSAETLPKAVVTPTPTAEVPQVGASPRVQVSPSPKAISTPRNAAGVETPKPIASPSPTPSLGNSRLERQQQLLEQRLAEIVAKERAEKQARQQAQQQAQQQESQDSLVNQAYNYATQRRFDRARQIAQNPAISAEVRNQILTQINDLERASRSLGVTSFVEPTKPPANSTSNPPASVASKPRSLPSLPQPQTIVQLPRSVQSLPNTPLRPQQTIIRNVPTSMQSDAPEPSSVVNPQNLTAFNPNVTELAKDQILYPLPEPVPVTSRFGWRVHPVTRVRRFHAGVDLGAAQGTPVLASRGGRVTVADRLGGYGLAVVMQHSDGTQDTLYAHLSQIFVRPGERIQPGTVIGRVGSTGLSTGPHLHYEARRKGNTGWVAVDPGAQIEAARTRLVQARQNARPARGES